MQLDIQRSREYYNPKESKGALDIIDRISNCNYIIPIEKINDIKLINSNVYIVYDKDQFFALHLLNPECGEKYLRAIVLGKYKYIAN